MSNEIADQFIGEIRPFAGATVPRDWHLCDGDILQPSSYPVLFALIGYTYGRTHDAFHLPDLRSRVQVGTGQSATHNYVRGEMAGGEKVALSTDQVAPHTHPAYATSDPATTFRTINAMPGALSGTGLFYYDGASGPYTTELAAATIEPSHPGQNAHNNVMPSLAINYIIALEGMDPRLPTSTEA